MSPVLVTVAIPALNEAVNIGRCIASIRRHFPPQLDLEILVGDHGSSDGTPGIAEKAGAKVMAFRGGTVGELRNRIVAAAKGSILLFLDADTTVTPEWGAGATIVVRPQLRVLHHDFPQTAMAFIRRECWHGSGDFQSIGRMLSSKVALAALLFLALQIGALVALIFSLRVFVGLEVVAALLVIAASFLKFPRLRPGARLANIGIFYLYLTGRCLSATALVRGSARAGH